MLLLQSKLTNNKLVVLAIALSILQSITHLSNADQESATIDAASPKLSNQDDNNQHHSKSELDAKDRYDSLKLKSQDLFLYEHFDDEQQFKSKWIPSKDPKYEGKAKLQPALNRPPTDKQLLLPEKARYYGISSKLATPFKFSSELNKPLIVQYEVEFRDGLDCGGAYIKLIRDSALNDLTQLDDKTPFTIMFGPDKCGSDSKLHFIIQYPNPKYEEKHWKKAKFVAPLTLFSDKLSHLFKLVLQPDNTFELFIDDASVGKGNLLEDLEPEINPPKEITDPNDTKPADWDERPQIDDPDAKKPDDWDEDLPKTIDDPNAVKPSDWLDEEPKYIADPDAKKPDDWEDMDGEWEAPLIENPACASASGCGEWKPPKIANPNFKGKWKAPKIDNPNFKGKWSPKIIPNPDYFYDQNPFTTLEPIGAVAFELWTMAENIAFDNLIITSDEKEAELVMKNTWQFKRPVPESSGSLFDTISNLTKDKSYLMLVPIVLGLILLYMIRLYFKKSKKSESIVKKKKLDESRPDDRLDEEPEGEEDGEDDDVAEVSGEADDDENGPEVVDDDAQVSDEEQMSREDASDVETEEEMIHEVETDDKAEVSEKSDKVGGAKRRTPRQSGSKK